jgi:hypothetical protein
MKEIVKYFKPLDISGILVLLGIVLGIILFLGYVYDSVQVFLYGSGTYYVNLFPENSESKNYRVVGEVEYDGDSGTYSLMKATFPNGGYITFDNYYGVGDGLNFYEKDYIEDDERNSWYVELTKEKVEE